MRLLGVWGSVDGGDSKILEAHNSDTFLGKQKVGYGTVVDGFTKFQALNFGISGPELSERFSF